MVWRREIPVLLRNCAPNCAWCVSIPCTNTNPPFSDSKLDYLVVTENCILVRQAV